MRSRSDGMTRKLTLPVKQLFGHGLSCAAVMEEELIYGWITLGRQSLMSWR